MVTSASRYTGIEDIVESLSVIDLPSTFNPYSEECTISDKNGAAELRRDNLVQYLDVVYEMQPRTAWVGEALGYRGGRRTGLPFSDDYHLEEYRDKFSIHPNQTTVDTLGESTATMIWEMLGMIEEPVFLWNSYPLHPHETHQPLSNRKPRVTELKEVHTIQKGLFGLINVEKIYALGRAPQRQLQDLGFSVIYIRHPSYGGKSKFVSSISSAYNVE